MLKGDFPKPRPKVDRKKFNQPLCISGEFIPPKPRPKDERVGLERIGHVVWYDKAKRFGLSCVFVTGRCLLVVFAAGMV